MLALARLPAQVEELIDELRLSFWCHRDPFDAIRPARVSQKNGVLPSRQLVEYGR